MQLLPARVCRQECGGPEGPGEFAAWVCEHVHSERACSSNGEGKSAKDCGPTFVELEDAGRPCLPVQVRAAEEELTSLKQAADARASEARGAEQARAAAQADKALLAAQVAAQRRKVAAAVEAADTAAIERGLLQRGAEDAQEAVQRLSASKAGAAGAKASAQVGRVERKLLCTDG